MEEKSAPASSGGCIICEMAVPILRRYWSEATKDHFRNSRVEFLKGLRSILDARIAQLSRDEPRGTHVTVE